MYSLGHPVQAQLKLATLFKQVSARWRVNAFRKAWSAAGREGKLPLLSLLPLWSLTIGAAGSALAAEVAREALASNDAGMAAALAGVAGDLVCVQSRQATMRRKGRVRLKISWLAETLVCRFFCLRWFPSVYLRATRGQWPCRTCGE